MKITMKIIDMKVDPYHLSWISANPGLNLNCCFGSCISARLFISKLQRRKLLLIQTRNISKFIEINELLGVCFEFTRVLFYFLERALYCFECSFHPLFNVTQGKSRMEYKNAENR
jgi:hypothetical protein